MSKFNRLKRFANSAYQVPTPRRHIWQPPSFPHKFMVPLNRLACPFWWLVLHSLSVVLSNSSSSYLSGRLIPFASLFNMIVAR